ncbi:MAG: hypothetical protein HYY24_17390 [Verrucomicrobia bacterium]|nr:hypothetical protein [Verrucomicrobiota bacterium]
MSCRADWADKGSVPGQSRRFYSPRIHNPQPAGASRANEFFLTGLLKKTSGSRTYPVEYTYDPQARMQTMKTWQNFAGGSGTAITTWNYDAYRGWLNSKDYADPPTGVPEFGACPERGEAAAGRLHRQPDPA